MTTTMMPASHVSSDLSSNPPTPPPSSAGGFLSNSLPIECFFDCGRHFSGQTRERKHSLEGMQSVPDLNVVKGPIPQEATTTTTTLLHDDLKKDVTLSATSSYRVTTTKVIDDEDDDDEEEEEEKVMVEEEEEEDEEYIFEERMGLRLGKGGRIGALDVRCV